MCANKDIVQLHRECLVSVYRCFFTKFRFGCGRSDGMQMFFTPIGKETSLVAYLKNKINDYIAPILSV